MEINIIIRQASEADFNLVSKFDSTDEYPSIETRRDDELIHSLIMTGSAYIATIEDLPVGYARVDYIWPSKVPLLSWLYVEKKF